MGQPIQGSGGYQTGADFRMLVKQPTTGCCKGNSKSTQCNTSTCKRTCQETCALMSYSRNAAATCHECHWHCHQPIYEMQDVSAATKKKWRSGQLLRKKQCQSCMPKQFLELSRNTEVNPQPPPPPAFPIPTLDTHDGAHPHDWSGCQHSIQRPSTSCQECRRQEHHREPHVQQAKNDQAPDCMFMDPEQHFVKVVFATQGEGGGQHGTCRGPYRSATAQHSTAWHSMAERSTSELIRLDGVWQTGPKECDTRESKRAHLKEAQGSV